MLTGIGTSNYKALIAHKKGNECFTSEVIGVTEIEMRRAIKQKCQALDAEGHIIEQIIELETKIHVSIREGDVWKGWNAL